MFPNPIVIDVDVGTNTTEIPVNLETSINVVIPKLQYKTTIPSSETQVIVPDEGYNALGKVTVEPIPSNYGLVTWNGSILTVS